MSALVVGTNARNKNKPVINTPSISNAHLASFLFLLSAVVFLISKKNKLHHASSESSNNSALYIVEINPTCQSPRSTPWWNDDQWHCRQTILFFSSFLSLSAKVCVFVAFFHFNNGESRWRTTSSRHRWLGSRCHSSSGSTDGWSEPRSGNFAGSVTSSRTGRREEEEKEEESQNSSTKGIGKLPSSPGIHLHFFLQERLTKATKGIFASPEKLNVACKRIDSILSGHKPMLLAVCRTLDKLDSGRLTYEDFRLGKTTNVDAQRCIARCSVFKDRLSEMPREDLFILSKLFESEETIDYRSILDESVGNGILQHITQLPVPPAKEIVLEKKPPKELRQPFSEPIRFNHPK